MKTIEIIAKGIAGIILSMVTIIYIGMDAITTAARTGVQNRGTVGVAEIVALLIAFAVLFTSALIVLHPEMLQKRDYDREYSEFNDAENKRHFESDYYGSDDND